MLDNPSCTFVNFGHLREIKVFGRHVIFSSVINLKLKEFKVLVKGTVGLGAVQLSCCQPSWIMTRKWDTFKYKELTQAKSLLEKPSLNLTGLGFDCNQEATLFRGAIQAYLENFNKFILITFPLLFPFHLKGTPCPTTTSNHFKHQAPTTTTSNQRVYMW